MCKQTVAKATPDLSAGAFELAARLATSGFDAVVGALAAAVLQGAILVLGCHVVRSFSFVARARRIGRIFFIGRFANPPFFFYFFGEPVAAMRSG